jgi:hypothetical protein
LAAADAEALLAQWGFFGSDTDADLRQSLQATSLLCDELLRQSARVFAIATTSSSASSFSSSSASSGSSTSSSASFTTSLNASNSTPHIHLALKELLHSGGPQSLTEVFSIWQHTFEYIEQLQTQSSSGVHFVCLSLQTKALFAFNSFSSRLSSNLICMS